MTDTLVGANELGLKKVRAEGASARILIVEDFLAFRQLISSMLDKRGGLHVIGEASDGLEAVQKAVELKPDLILLDIGLPSLNGIDAARRILELVPECKIIFVSQESAAEIVQKAMGLGASGYVVKTKAKSELIVAVETVISGKKFVSMQAN